MEKRNRQLTLGGVTYTWSPIQIPEPDTTPPKIFSGDPHLRTAATRRDVELWLSKVAAYTRGLEDSLDQLLERLPRKAELLKTLPAQVGKMLGAGKLDGLDNVAEAYGDIGQEVTEVADDLKTIFGLREKWVAIVGSFVDKMEALNLEDTDPIKVYLMESAANLNLDETVV